MSFEQEFQEWLVDALPEKVPEGVVAFSFNLYEPALRDGVKFGVEVVGTSEFDPEDEDWACEEVWEPQERQLFIPIEFSGTDWAKCQDRLKELLLQLLLSEHRLSSVLKSTRGIGVGFVDGSLDIVWQP
ncbi:MULTISPECIES: hypothetical protein [unclassified Pseudoalteromonas]|uniref:hypothetical protein n=1 Tax=unclassified Pseudoalteromonas TaxID=194690 RepID=UPI00101FDAF6|nr:MULTISPECIES: hypothetical protein [unclassified Pseudoalteromonas]MCG9709387.1 hypothetical protein [Pseudoalteromonas sp. Isolate3]MCP4584856.1 hypothetical protein [Pseudoalteromonas sp.]RZD20047.1 hypothetical protein EVU92_18215 [Pseudoalteromonas sp. MEBiC 03485]URQ92469.1 hypothetical protein J8Z25_20615 [Pseudoalteromonas sp. SCSIO 43101]